MLSVRIFKETDVPVYLIAVSLAVWQRMTVKIGQTVDLSCPITNAHHTNVDWRNPDGHIMFFKHGKGEDDISGASTPTNAGMPKLFSCLFTFYKHLAEKIRLLCRAKFGPTLGISELMYKQQHKLYNVCVKIARISQTFERRF